MSCDFFLFPVISLGRRRKGKRKNRRRRKPRKTTLILLSRTRVKETKWRSVIRRHLLLGPSSRTPVNPRRRHQSLRRRLGRRRRRQIRRRKVQFRRRQMRLRRLRRFQIGGTPCPSFRKAVGRDADERRSKEAKTDLTGKSAKWLFLPLFGRNVSRKHASLLKMRTP